MKTLAIIRPDKQLEDSKKVVESCGYDVLATTMVDIVPIRDLLWPTFLDELNTGRVDYVVITSANGARTCAELRLNAASFPSSTQVVAIGPKTRSALLKAHLRVDLMPSEYSSRGIVQMLSDVARKNIWVLRSAFGSSELTEGLQNSGAAVNEIVLYTLKKLCGQGQRDFIRELVENDVAGVLFTSAMTVHALFDCADRIGMKEHLIERLANQVVGAIGRPTAEALGTYEVRVDIIPSNATFRKLVSTIHTILTDRAPQ
jgi:uroporphyrinogen-III synthase